MLPRNLALLAVLSALWAGCSDDDGRTGSGSPSLDTTRSTTCLQMQDAVCDKFADGCNALTRADCDDTFQSLFCVSEEQASACLQDLPQTSCLVTPASCKNIADTAKAQAICSDFISQFCRRVLSCSGIDEKTCQEQISPSLDCSLAVGIGPSYDTCTADLASDAACSGDKQVTLPPACKGVVKLDQSFSFEAPLGFELAEVLGAAAVLTP